MKIVFCHNYLWVLVVLIFASCKSGDKKIYGLDGNKGENFETLELLVGTFTGTGSRGIYKVNFDPTTGELSDAKLLVEEQGPSYIEISKNRKIVYSVNRTKPGSVSVFNWSKNRSGLNLVGRHTVQGEDPCFIELNQAENLVAIANYRSGNIAVYPIGHGGNVVGEIQTKSKANENPVANSKVAHAHCVKFGLSDRFLYDVDLGLDAVFYYEIDHKGRLGNQQKALELDVGDGPRHMIFHPTKNLAFVINELSSTVVSATVDKEKGSFERVDRKNTLPTDYNGKNSCADIRLSRNGKFLYVSNRGHNSIAIFSIDDDGKLNFIDCESVRGDWPRNFVISPDGEFLLVANRKSNNITVFKINKKTGLLTYTGNQIALFEPVCLKF